MDDQQEQNETTHKIREILSPNFTFTKRQLGIGLLTIGVLGFLAILGLDLVGGGRQGGIGPAQMAALVVMAFVALLGLTLIPLGDEPA
jgi:hypothetical protein